MERESVLNFQNWVAAPGQFLLDSTLSSGGPSLFRPGQFFGPKWNSCGHDLALTFPCCHRFLQHLLGAWGQWKDYVHLTLTVMSGLVFVQEYNRRSENTNSLLLFSLWGLWHPAPPCRISSRDGKGSKMKELASGQHLVLHLFRQTPEMPYMWNQLWTSTSEGIRVNSLMFSQGKKKKPNHAGILSSLTAGLCIPLMRFQERWLLGRGSRILFCMQISVLNWRSYSLMMPGQQQQYPAIPFAVIISWPWDLPNWGSTVSINIPFFQDRVFSCIRDNPSEE